MKLSYKLMLLSAFASLTMICIGCNEASTNSTNESSLLETISETTSASTTQIMTSTTRLTTTTISEYKYKAENDKTFHATLTVDTADIYDSKYENIDSISNDKKLQTDDFLIDGDGFFYFHILGEKDHYIFEESINGPYVQYIQLIRDMYYAEPYNTVAQFDIDKDGTNEWLFQTGSAEYEYKYDVYSVASNDADIELLGSIPFGNLFVDKDDNLILQQGHMGVETDYSVTIKNNEISYDTLYTQENVDEYSKPGKEISTKSFIDILGENYINPYNTPEVPENSNNSDEIPDELSQDALYNVATALNVPDYMTISFKQSEPVYWEAVGTWLTYVEVISDDKIIASAAVDLYTGEPAREINNYDDTPDFLIEAKPNVKCPDCGYSWFVTGVGADGFTCSQCGRNFMPNESAMN